MTERSRRPVAGSGSKSQRMLRVSERQGIALEVSRLEAQGRALGNLMTEACRTPDGWATYYCGTRVELCSAGVPEYLFAAHKRPVKFRANGHPASLQRRGSNQFELTLHWDHNGPWYHSAEHPALAELARMIHIAISYWMGDLTDPEVETRKLLACDDATDYRLPAGKCFRFTDEFKMRINSLQSQIYHAIKTAEILPMQAAPVDYDQTEDDEAERLQFAQQATRETLDRVRRKSPRC